MGVWIKAIQVTQECFQYLFLLILHTRLVTLLDSHIIVRCDQAEKKIGLDLALVLRL
jgi:hypothetical protein